MSIHVAIKKSVISLKRFQIGAPKRNQLLYQQNSDLRVKIYMTYNNLQFVERVHQILCRNLYQAQLGRLIRETFNWQRNSELILIRQPIKEIQLFENEIRRFLFQISYLKKQNIFELIRDLSVWAQFMDILKQFCLRI